jgi:hypothetical protein
VFIVIEFLAACTGSPFYHENFMRGQVVGAGLVSAWAYGLLRDTGRVLLDAETAKKRKNMVFMFFRVALALKLRGTLHEQ